MGIIAIRSFCDDWLLNANCVDAALAAHLTLEHGFTNMEFVALAADAMEVGDIGFFQSRFPASRWTRLGTHNRAFPHCKSS